MYMILDNQILNDDKIMKEIHDEKENGENKNECFENDLGSSHNEAFECLETAIKWLERQNDADPI